MNKKEYQERVRGFNRYDKCLSIDVYFQDGGYEYNGDGEPRAIISAQIRNTDDDSILHACDLGITDTFAGDTHWARIQVRTWFKNMLRNNREDSPDFDFGFYDKLDDLFGVLIHSIKPSTEK